MRGLALCLCTELYMSYHPRQDARTNEGDREIYLPIDLRFSRADVRVTWMDFGDKQLTEPFFHQTVEKLRARRPPAREWESDLRALVRRASCLPALTPSGLIFHIG